MSDILVRGLSKKVHRWVRNSADSEHLSTNQFFLRFVARGLKEIEAEEERVQRQKEAFHRINEQREALYKKYGLFEDSTPWIREDRENH